MKFLVSRARKTVLFAILGVWTIGLYAQAPVPDTLEQRVVACAACHGKNGEGLKANEYYPRIAGKPAGYLFNQLLNFRERRRQSPPMNYIVAFLSEDYLRDIARHYAMRPPAYPAPQGNPPSEVLARGEALMKRGDPARKIPGLVGLEVHYIGAQMGAWRNGLRRAQAPDCMANIASLLIPGDVEAIAAYLASLPLPPLAEPLRAGSLKPPMECGGT